MSTPDATTPSPAALAMRFDLLAADTTEYALFLVDPGGRLVCWNVGAERLFGYRPDEVVGRHVSVLFTPEDIVSGQPEYELVAARDGGRAGGDRWQVRRDGSRFWCHTTVTALYDQAKKP